MNNFDLSIFDTSFTFTKRPKPIPGDLRPMWKISINLLILELASRAGKSSLSRLHVLNWAIRTEINQKNLIQVLSQEMSPTSIIVRIVKCTPLSRPKS